MAGWGGGLESLSPSPSISRDRRCHGPPRASFCGTPILSLTRHHARSPTPVTFHTRSKTPHPPRFMLRSPSPIHIDHTSSFALSPSFVSPAREPPRPLPPFRILSRRRSVSVAAPPLIPAVINPGPYFFSFATAIVRILQNVTCLPFSQLETPH
jgi:hypothetical protein